MILIDEAHHAAAPTYLKILEYFGAMTKESEVVVIGVSATLSRLDGLKLGTASTGSFKKILFENISIENVDKSYWWTFESFHIS